MIFDVLLHDQIGGAFSASTVTGPTGGGELHLVQIAEALTRRGWRVAVSNGVSSACEENGVTYVPNAIAPPARVVVVNRYSPDPGVKRERTVLHAIDPYNPAYDRHRKLLDDPSVALIAVSQWAANTFHARGPVWVINPMLDPIPSGVAKEDGLFVWCAASLKGLPDTLAAWSFLKQKYPIDTAGLRLEVSTPGYGAPDPSLIRATPDCKYVGHLPPDGIRRQLARAVGLFHVSTHTETFLCLGALAEMAGARTHILALRGLGGIPEALSNRRLLTESREQFEVDFLAALDAPDDPRWRSEAVPDRSPDALAEAWEIATRVRRRYG